ncbi:MAG: hypothetical protein ACRDKY_02880 [Solirubrobacteraceae bacterium]
MSRTALLVALAVAVSLGFAACGGDGDDKLSRSELAKKADAICAESKAASLKHKLPRDFARDPVVAAAYLNKIVPITRKQTDEFAKLKPEDDIKDEWNQLVERQKQANETLKTVRDKAEAKDPSGVEDLAKAERVSAKFVQEAKAVGATGCAAG